VNLGKVGKWGAEITGLSKSSGVSFGSLRRNREEKGDDHLPRRDSLQPEKVNMGFS